MAKRNRRIWKSFWYAIKGLFYALRTQTNMQTHVGITFVVVVSGFYFHVSVIEWLFLILAIFLVQVTELINTAIELNVDLVTKKLRPRAMVAKDVAAGAVLMASIGAIIIGLIIFGNKVLF